MLPGQNLEIKTTSYLPRPMSRDRTQFAPERRAPLSVQCHPIVSSWSLTVTSTLNSKKPPSRLRRPSSRSPRLPSIQSLTKISVVGSNTSNPFKKWHAKTAPPPNISWSSTTGRRGSNFLGHSSKNGYVIFQDIPSLFKFSFRMLIRRISPMTVCFYSSSLHVSLHVLEFQPRTTKIGRTATPSASSTKTFLTISSPSGG